MRYDVIPPNAGLYYDFTSDPFCQKALDRSGRIRNVDKSAYLYGPKWVPIGLEFDGVDDYCEVENNEDADITVATPEKPLTLAVVAKPMANTTMFLASKNYELYTTYQYGIYYEGSTQLFRSVFSDLDNVYSQGVRSSIGETIYYITSFDSTILREYKNGQLRNALPRAGDIASRPYLYFGCRMENPGIARKTLFFQGTISEIYVGHAQPNELISWFERSGRFERYGIAR